MPDVTFHEILQTINFGVKRKQNKQYVHGNSFHDSVLTSLEIYVHYYTSLLLCVKLKLCKGYKNNKVRPEHSNLRIS